MDRPPQTAGLIAAGRLEIVPIDATTGLERLRRAEGVLATAAKLLETDTEIAYVIAYDAARRAIAAHMLAHGIRALAKPRAHEAIGIYAEEMLSSPSATEFQRIRRRRNKAEYEDVVLGLADVRADLEHLTAIVTEIAGVLSG